MMEGITARGGQLVDQNLIIAESQRVRGIAWNLGEQNWWVVGKDFKQRDH